MAKLSDVSDGEIVGDLSDISSGENDYFENLKKTLNKRKRELERENKIAFIGKFGYGKENHHTNHRAKRTSTKSRRYETNRNRSYRASSVFSTYSLPKPRQKKTRQSRKKKHVKYQFLKGDLSEELSDQLNENNSEMPVAVPSSDEEDELLELRLQALKSKQEVKELIAEDNTPISLSSKIEVDEADQLRIIALKSKLMKKKEFFKERKKQKMMESLVESERPYSPSDDLTPIAIEDDAMSMILSPLGSPFNEVVEEIHHQEDMEISNDEKEASDMDMSKDQDSDTPNELTETTLVAKSVEEDDEEIALRSLLLTSITKKKEPEIIVPTEKVTIKNLKLAVQRLKQKKEVIPNQKSGNKTIAMILAEKRTRNKSEKLTTRSPTPEKQDEPNVTNEKNIPEVDVVDTQHKVVIVSIDVPIKNEIVQQQPIEIMKPPPSPPDSSISTITDTKNIPLLPTQNKNPRSRLITTLVPKQVPRVVISVNQDSDTDDESLRNKVVPIKKTARRIIQAPVISKPKVQEQVMWEAKLENFLKNIRQKTGNEIQATTQKAPVQSTTTAPSMISKSSLKHLPLSSQVEYEQLLQKMKILEETKQKRLKTRELKKTKSITEVSEPKPNSPPKKRKVTEESIPVAPIKPQINNKIAESLKMIPHLDSAAQQRLMVKTENNFKNHSNNLLNAAQQSITLLEKNEADMKKQEKLVKHISDLEQLLNRYKANLNVVNQKVKSNVHEIVKSERDMIKLRTHHQNFGKICMQVGVMIRGGDDYSLPELNHMNEIHEHYAKIASKTEDIITKMKDDQNIGNNVKLIVDRVKTFCQPVEKKKVSDTLEEAKENAEKIETVSVANSSNKEIAITDVMHEETVEEIKFETRKQILDATTNEIASKISGVEKMSFEIYKPYVSPLEFLRLPNKYDLTVNEMNLLFNIENF